MLLAREAARIEGGFTFGFDFAAVDTDGRHTQNVCHAASLLQFELDETGQNAQLVHQVRVADEVKAVRIVR
ncbi:hypothetical protein GTGU_04805, partial [Trabulsiella guamensis ATCC 49490]